MASSEIFQGAAGAEQRLRVESLARRMERWAAVMPSYENLDKYLPSINMQVVGSTVLPAGLTLICAQDLKVLPEPKIHDYSHLFTNTPDDISKISHALYHVDEFEHEGHKVWLHDLPYGLHTTDHTHDTVEIQRVLYGKITVDGQRIPAGQANIVAPGTYHRAIAVDEPAIMLCVLVDAAGNNKETVHRF